MSKGKPRGPLLAIDTSTLNAGLAVYGAGGVEAEVQWRAGRAQTAALLTTIDYLLRLAGHELAALGAVAIASGPGAFNGLRVGMSTAKGLAYGLGLPLLAVPTLDATAYPYRDVGRPIRAVAAAGRGRLVSALYRGDRGQTRRAGDYLNATLEQLAASIVEPTIVVGELEEDQVTALRALAPSVSIPTPALRLRRATSIAEIAWSRFQAEDHDDPAVAEPVYAHRKSGEAADALQSALQERI